MDPPFTKGNRVKVIRDNGRTGLIEYHGTVDSVNQLGVIVILDADPALRHRMNMIGGFALPRPPIRRFFNFGDIEKVQ